jgi:hypothetical protein
VEQFRTTRGDFKGWSQHIVPAFFFYLDTLPVGVAAPVLAAIGVEGGGLVGQALVKQQNSSPTCVLESIYYLFITKQVPNHT